MEEFNVNVDFKKMDGDIDNAKALISAWVLDDSGLMFEEFVRTLEAIDLNKMVYALVFISASLITVMAQDKGLTSLEMMEVYSGIELKARIGEEL